MILAKVYFVKEYTKFLALTLIFALALIFILDLAEVIRSGNDKILLMTGAKSCKNIIQLMPLVVLVSTIITFSSLSKKNELVVFSTLGLSNKFFLKIIGVAITIIFILIIGVLIPITKSLTISVENNNNNRGSFKQLVFKTSQNTFIRIGTLNLHQAENITIWILDNDFGLKEVITAHSGSTEKDLLILDKPKIEKKLSCENLDKMAISIGTTQDHIENSILQPEQISLLEIPAFISNLKKIGFSTSQYERYFCDKITIFINLLVMALVGFISSFSLVERLARKEKIFFGLVAGLVIFFIQDLIVTILPYSIGISVILAKVIIAAIVISIYSTVKG